MKKNGWNVDTADVECTVAPSRFLSALLAQELAAAGFKVVTEPARATSAALRIEGLLWQFFVEPYVGAFTYTPEADIELQLLASSQSGLSAHRRLYLKGEEMSFVGTENNFQAAADAAVQKMLSAAVGAIAELVRQFPQLGRPAPVATAAYRGRHERARR